MESSSSFWENSSRGEGGEDGVPGTPGPGVGTRAFGSSCRLAADIIPLRTALQPPQGPRCDLRSGDFSFRKPRARFSSHKDISLSPNSHPVGPWADFLMHLDCSFLVYEMGVPAPTSQDLDGIEKGVLAALSKARWFSAEPLPVGHWC